MTHYQTLGVPRTATQAEIKAAYRAKAKKLHPDHGGSEEKFKALTLAYQVLRDPAQRRLYDAPKPRTAKPSKSPRATPHNPHPNSQPPTPAEMVAMAAAMRSLGLSLIFEVVPDFAPPGPLRDTLNKARRENQSNLEAALNSILGAQQ